MNLNPQQLNHLVIGDIEIMSKNQQKNNQQIWYQSNICNWGGFVDMGCLILVGNDDDDEWSDC